MIELFYHSVFICSCKNFEKITYLLTYLPTYLLTYLSLSYRHFCFGGVFVNAAVSCFHNMIIHCSCLQSIKKNKLQSIKLFTVPYLLLHFTLTMYSAQILYSSYFQVVQQILNVTKDLNFPEVHSNPYLLHTQHHFFLHSFYK